MTTRQQVFLVRNDFLEPLNIEPLNYFIIKKSHGGATLREIYKLLKF